MKKHVTAVAYMFVVLASVYVFVGCLRVGTMLWSIFTFGIPAWWEITVNMLVAIAVNIGVYGLLLVWLGALYVKTTDRLCEFDAKARREAVLLAVIAGLIGAAVLAAFMIMVYDLPNTLSPFMPFTHFDVIMIIGLPIGLYSLLVLLCPKTRALFHTDND